MHNFDYSKNFWPRWRDYPEAFSALIKSNTLVLHAKCHLDTLRKTFNKNVGIIMIINPYCPHVVLKSFDGENIYIEHTGTNLFIIVKQLGGFPSFKGKVTTGSGGLAIEGTFGYPFIPKLVTILWLMFILLFKIVGLIILICSIFSGKISLLFISVLWLFLVYIGFKFSLFLIMCSSVYERNIEKYILLMLRDSEAL